LRTAIVLILSVGLLAAGASVVASAVGAESAPDAGTVGVYASAEWYQSRPEAEQCWRGVLREREPVAGPGGRTATSLELSTADAAYPVYAAGVGRRLMKPFVGRVVEVQGKLVDLGAEGFEKELWVATMRALDAKTR